MLREYTDRIRLVSRTPERVNQDDELHPADLLDADEVRGAVAGADAAYLTVGFPYKTDVWRSAWPKTMRNVIEACKTNDVSLVFFDNVYMYDADHLDPITEDAPINPPSEKGKVRADIARMLLDEAAAGNLRALIARSADFYGPSIEDTGILNETIVNNLSQEKKANWLGSVDYKHSFTYTPDAGRATALLGNTPEAYGEVWHLPTAPDPPTGREWIEMIAEALGTEPKYREVSKWMARIMGLFSSEMSELVEMMYQYDRHYVFDSTKFEEHFDVKPTPYERGIREMITADYGR